MRNRLKATITGTLNRQCRIYWNSDLKEYQVKLFMDGQHYAPADYFTTDEHDALGSARNMCTRPAAAITTEAPHTCSGR